MTVRTLEFIIGDTPEHTLENLLEELKNIKGEYIPETPKQNPKKIWIYKIMFVRNYGNGIKIKW